MIIIAILLGFILSATMGAGGSLIIVPAMVALLDPKEGVAMSAFLLAANNVLKFLVYGRYIPWRTTLTITATTMLGAYAGTRLLVAAPEPVVWIAVISSMAIAFIYETGQLRMPKWLTCMFRISNAIVAQRFAFRGRREEERKRLVIDFGR